MLNNKQMFHLSFSDNFSEQNLLKLSVSTTIMMSSDIPLLAGKSCAFSTKAHTKEIEGAELLASDAFVYHDHSFASVQILIWCGCGGQLEKPRSP